MSPSIRLANASFDACRRIARQFHADPLEGVSFVYLRIFPRIKACAFGSDEAINRYLRRSTKFEALQFYTRQQNWWTKENSHEAPKGSNHALDERVLTSTKRRTVRNKKPA